MGWNTSALFIEDIPTADAIAVLAGATPAPDGRLVGADEATSGLVDGVLYAARAGGWTQVWDPSMELVPACTPPGNALTVVFSSVASTYAFTLFAAGRAVRELVYADGDAVVDTGDPLPVEAGIEVPSWGPDEDFLWTVIEAVTGTGYPEALSFQTWHRR